MEHSRKQKLLMIVALIVAIASLSVGFAAFSVTLNISSSASVTPSSDTFSVKFSNSIDSLVEGKVGAAGYSTGITPYDAVIDNSGNPTVKGFGATFTEPDQFVEYGVYARNEGEYTAYLNSVNFIGENVCIGEAGTTESLVQAACDSIYINVRVGDVTYNETTPVSGHSLASGEGELIYIYVEYASSGVSVDGPFSIILPDISLVYSTVDNSSIQPTISESFMKVESGDIKTIGSVVSIGDENFYVIGHENGNVKLLSMYNLYVGGIYNGNYIEYGNEATGIQESSLGANQGVIPFNDDENKATNYEGSLIESYVENYKIYLESLGSNIAKARLITLEELEKLGCDISNHSCKDTFEFVVSTYYWTMTSKDLYYILGVSEHSISYTPYSIESDYGVRPVIEISLSEF